MGSVCDSTTGQCVCVPTRHGKDCSSCRPGELETQINDKWVVKLNIGEANLLKDKD